MNDNIEVFGEGSIIQHGKHNDRVYLMKLKKQDTSTILEELSKLAYKYKYSKIFCKVPKNIAPLFISQGYILEGYIPKFYNSKNDVFFLSKFLNSNRLLEIENEQLIALHKLLLNKQIHKEGSSHSAVGYKIRRLNTSDIEQISEIYTEVFETYPFPIHNPEYIRKTMNENIQYYGVEKNGKITALASSEIDIEGKNAEMTDFATSIAHKGKNLSNLLLETMEKEMKKQGITTLYTIARLNSIPMNKTFLRNNYEYSGSLIKNTNISGKIESMNIYYKHI